MYAIYMHACVYVCIHVHRYSYRLIHPRCFWHVPFSCRSLRKVRHLWDLALTSSLLLRSSLWLCEAPGA